jgi:hypothetical protein
VFIFYVQSTKYKRYNNFPESFSGTFAVFSLIIIHQRVPRSCSIHLRGCITCYQNVWSWRSQTTEYKIYTCFSLLLFCFFQNETFRMIKKQGRTMWMYMIMYYLQMIRTPGVERSFEGKFWAGRPTLIHNGIWIFLKQTGGRVLCVRWMKFSKSFIQGILTDTLWMLTDPIRRVPKLL